MAEELATEIEGVTDALKAEMDARSVDTLTGDDYKITYKAVTSARFDSAAFKRDFADVYEGYCKPSTTRRFLVA